MLSDHRVLHSYIYIHTKGTFTPQCIDINRSAPTLSLVHCMEKKISQAKGIEGKHFKKINKDKTDDKTANRKMCKVVR